MSTHIDNERVAAFLDGRLSSEERAEVLAQLAESDGDTLAALSDAAALLDNTHPSLTTKPRRTRIAAFTRAPRFHLVMEAAAAGLILILAFASSRSSSHTGAPPGFPYGELVIKPPRNDGTTPAVSPRGLDYTTDFVAELTVFGASPRAQAPTARVVSPAGVDAAPETTTVRVVVPGQTSKGPRLSNVLARPVEQGFPDQGVGEMLGADELIPVRVGSLLTDLRLSSRGRGSREAAAAKLAVLLRGVDQEHAGMLFDAIARAPAGSTQASDSAITVAIESVSPIGGSRDGLTVGALLEAARFAASTKDTVFFARNWALLESRIAALPDENARLMSAAIRLKASVYAELDPYGRYMEAKLAYDSLWRVLESHRAAMCQAGTRPEISDPCKRLAAIKSTTPQALQERRRLSRVIDSLLGVSWPGLAWSNVGTVPKKQR